MTAGSGDEAQINTTDTNSAHATTTNRLRRRLKKEEPAVGVISVLATFESPYASVLSSGWSKLDASVGGDMFGVGWGAS